MAGPAGLRLLYVANPSSVHVLRWTRFFVERGHSVTVVDGFGSEPHPELQPEVRIVRYEPRGMSNVPFSGMLRARRRMHEVVSELEPDIIHAHTARRYAWHAALAGFHPYVVSVWGSDVLLPFPSWRSRLLTRVALHNADLVTAVTPQTREAAIGRGARSGRTVEIHHGVDTELFRPGDVPEDTRRRLGIGNEPFVFSPRALRPIYNHETVVEAAARVSGTHRLVVTSAGADPEYRARVERLAASRLGQDRLVVVSVSSEADLAALYRAADVVISAALSDSFPLTIQEAMASGTPVVAGDLPPIRAVFGTLAPAALAPVTDPVAIGAALRHAIELGASERRELGERLRAYVHEHADWREHMTRMEEHYRRLAMRG